MATKNLEGLMERVRQWPERRQEGAAEILREVERQDAGVHWLSDAQAEAVARIQRGLREGSGMLATDERMAALWKSCGL